MQMKKEVHGPVEGTIEVLKSNQRGFKLGNGEWYSVFAREQLQGAGKGTSIKFVYTEGAGDPPFKNVQGNVMVVGDSPSYGPEDRPKTPTTRHPMLGEVHITRERTIARQNALTNAVNYYKDKEHNHDDVIEVAKEFESYTCGDQDWEEYQAAKKEVD